MKKFHSVLGSVAAVSLTGSSLAELVSLTVTSITTGTGLYEAFGGAVITITMKLDDQALATAVGENSITSEWSIEVTRAGSTLLKGSGNSSFAVSENTPAGSDQYSISGALTGYAWATMGLFHAPDLIQITYAATGDQKLLEAITASANSPAGQLTVSTTSGDEFGAIEGTYTVVPAPSALALVAVGFAARRRRRA